MKKKLVSLLLTATMVMGVLSGCGNGKTSVSQTGDTSTDEKVEMAAADDVPNDSAGNTLLNTNGTDEIVEIPKPLFAIRHTPRLLMIRTMQRASSPGRYFLFMIILFFLILL